MSDEKLRELERRWRETGTEEDASNYLRERMRTGCLDPLVVAREMVRAQRFLVEMYLPTVPENTVRDPISDSDLLALFEGEGPLVVACSAPVDVIVTPPIGPDLNEGPQQEFDRVALEALEEAAETIDFDITDHDDALEICRIVGPAHAVLLLYIRRVLYDIRVGIETAARQCDIRIHEDLHKLRADAEEAEQVILTGGIPIPEHALLMEAYPRFSQLGARLRLLASELALHESLMEQAQTECVRCAHVNHDGRRCSANEDACVCDFNSQTHCLGCSHPIHAGESCGVRVLEQGNCACTWSQPRPRPARAWRR